MARRIVCEIMSQNTENFPLAPNSLPAIVEVNNYYIFINLEFWLSRLCSGFWQLGQITEIQKIKYLYLNDSQNPENFKTFPKSPD